MKRRIASVAVAAALLALAHCVAGGGPTLDGVVLTDVEYVLAWDTTGVVREDGAVTFESDLGDRIRVERGSLVAYSATLAPCEEEPAHAALRALVGTPVAHAGHFDEVDPSAVESPLVEDLVAAATVALGRASFRRAGYCRLHYLSADHESAAGASLSIEGTWTRGAETRPLSLRTKIASGALFDLADVPTTGAQNGAAAQITLVRPLRALFDGVDLGAATPGDAASDVLRNVVHGASASMDRR